MLAKVYREILESVVEIYEYLKMVGSDSPTMVALLAPQGQKNHLA